LAHGPRKFRNPGTGQKPNADINVTPLVDIVLVMLIIFMVVTPLIEKDIEIRLPEEPQDEQLEMPPDQQSQLVVQISATGDVAVNTERIAIDALGERLTKALNAKRKGERLVFFLPDEKANYGVVVKTLDIAKHSGADILGMVTMDPTQQPQQAPVGDVAAPSTP
jgi:biopolymer transport protein ExbD